MRLKVTRLKDRMTMFPTFRMLMIALAGFAGASVMFAGSASAQNPVVDLGKTILGIQDEKPELDYRPRPPLVIPPKMELPKPIEKAAKPAQWPNDPDVAAQRAAAEARKKPAEKVGTEGRPLTIEEMRAGRVAGAGVPTAIPEPVAPRNMSAWIPPSELKLIEDKIKLAKSAEMAPGQEPPRQWLTDPPKGYRKPADGAAVSKPKMAPQINNEREESSPLAVFRKPKQEDD